MAQEVVAHGSRAGLAGGPGTPTRAHCPSNPIDAVLLDLLRCRPGCHWLCHRLPDPCRPTHPQLLRPVRSDSIGPLQRHRRHVAQR